MADKKISELNPLTGANSATGDLFVLVDVSTGVTKHMTRAELIEALGPNFTKLTVDTDTLHVDEVNGRVGIKTLIPAKPLEVGGDIGIFRDYGYVFLNAVGGAERAGITSNVQSDLIFSTGAPAEAMRIEADGAMLVGTTVDGSAGAGDIVANGGIFLGGSAAANKLDDYEEGTWTPTIEFSGASVGVTYSKQNGFYTKVGNLVTASCYVVLSSKGTSTGDAKIEGLPFTSSATANQLTNGAFRPQDISFNGVITSFLNVSSTTLNMFECTDAGVSSAIDDTNFTNTTSLMATINYRV